MTTKGTVNLPAPYVDPKVSDPIARSYAEDVRRRRGGAPEPPKYTTEVAGGPAPPIPLLDTPHQDGRTMAQQASQQRGLPQPGVAPVGGIFGPGDAPSAPPGAPPPPPRPNAPGPPLALTNMDMLPDHARTDPTFIDGMGSQYAISQPELARKYGVIRNGQFIPPQQLVRQPQHFPGAPPQGLSQQTVEGLKALDKVQEAARAQTLEEQDKAAEKSSYDNVGSAADIGAPPLPAMSEMELDQVRNKLVIDLLQNDEQRKIIEERLPPLDLSQLIMEGKVRQTVPIQPGIFEPTFQSLSAEEDLALKRLIISDANNLQVNDRYYLDKFSYMSVACGTYAINRAPLINHMVNGVFDDEAFWKKFTQVSRLPIQMLASLGTNFLWFDMRVRKLFVAERLKNG